MNLLQFTSYFSDADGDSQADNDRHDPGHVKRLTNGPGGRQRRGRNLRNRQSENSDTITSPQIYYSGRDCPRPF